ncbi:MAG: polyprenyl synthetase family protein [Candidatus Bathyarchaeota archaeon]|nr:polyprenyl synthetase family protein [Candidatus Bathyarchaeum tardum]WGM89579.1 MAG: polyprenyl synthetase family protein [Candidatus Bathyarchaeum tardum]WNZ30317.1 MAG: polyprenyl synthetase family protein [Candidatus Bathyarchaeota archaeon]
MSPLSTQISDSAQKVNKFIETVVDIEAEPKVLYQASRHIIDAGGKRLRPFLVLKTCSLVGGKEQDAIATASSMELLHTFTLLHDDIMDQDEKRRGVPSVHTKYGVPIAIVAGDLLFAKVFEVITKNTDQKNVTPKRILHILQELSEATIVLCEGQTRDILFEDNETVTEAEYFEMIEGKTAALFETSARCGGIIGGATKTQVKRLGEFGRYAGIAFQVIDDVLALTADEKVLKKPVGNDIREGKRTLMVVYALKKASKTQRQKILETLGNKNASADQIKETIGLIDSLGAISYAKKMADKYITKCKKVLAKFPDCADKEDLLSLADLIFDRQN